jgi:uncharacterized membrane protein
MLNRAELKAKARESLEGHLGDSIGVIILSYAIPMIANVLVLIICKILNLSDGSTSFLTSITSTLVYCALAFGYFSYFLKLSRDEDVEISELWSFKGKWYIYIGIYLLAGLFACLWGLLLIIPGIIAAISYSMSYYCYLDNPENDIMDAIKESKRIMKGHKMEFFILQLSFLGWSILGMFTFGILYLWLIPYMSVTISNFYNNIKELS